MPQPHSPSYRSSRRNRSRSPNRDRNNRRQSYRDISRSRSRGSNDNILSSRQHNPTSVNKSDHHYTGATAKNQRHHYDYDSNSNSNSTRYVDRYNRYETAPKDKEYSNHPKYNHKYDTKYDHYDNKRDHSRSSSKSYHTRDSIHPNDKVHNKRERDSSRRDRTRNEEDKRRKSRFSSYSTRGRSEFKHPTNIAILKGSIPSNYGAMHVESAVAKYHPSSICIIRAGDTLLSDIKYILVRFENISSTIAFVEDNEFHKSGEFVLSNKIKLSVQYHKWSGNRDNTNDIKALESDWLCAKCYFYNLYNRNRKGHKCGREDCNGSLSMKCIRVDSLTGHPYILGEIVVDKAKGSKINLKSCAVLAMEGIDVNTTEDIIRNAFQPIAEIDSIYIVNKSECDPHGMSYKRGCIAFMQFKTSDLAKSALKQALLNHVTVSSLPINLAFIAYNGRNGNPHNGNSNHHALNGGDNAVNALNPSAAFIRSNALQTVTASSDTVHTNNLGPWSNPNLNNMNLLIPKASDFGIADSFQWDATANCFYDPNSGYYYDIHRNLYYFSGNFYEWNVQIMQYVQVKDPHAANTEDADRNDADGDVKMNKNAVDEEDNQEEEVKDAKDKEEAAAGPIKFGFKSQPKQSLNDAQQANKGGNNDGKEENNKINNMELTEYQKEMMNDLPIALQNKVNKFCSKDKLCCYLCRRKLKTFHDLCQHIKLSEFHLCNLSKWVAAKRMEINSAADKFYQSIGGTANGNTRLQVGQKQEGINTNSVSGHSHSKNASLQDKFLKMMSAYDNSRCDKSSDGGTRALMK